MSVDIQNIAGTTWEFNDVMSFDGASWYDLFADYIYIPFVDSENNEWDGISFEFADWENEDYETVNIYYLSYDNENETIWEAESVLVYNSTSDGWTSSAKTITFTDGVSPESSEGAISNFEEWLDTNATEQTEPEVVNYLATSTDLISVANAIRTKGGTNSTLSFPSGWISAINNISTGPSSSDAILRVLIYSGATITMSKGNLSLTPTTHTLSSDQLYEVALFVIESSKFDSQNAWTLTSTINNLTYSTTVFITTNKDYYTELTRVPVDYQEVEYIYSNGATGAYINIGITPYQVHGGTFGYQINTVVSNGFLWGAGVTTNQCAGTGSLGLGVGTTAQMKGLLYNSTTLDDKAYTAGVRYDGSFSCSNGSQTQTTNNYIASGSATGELTNEKSISIFCFNRAGAWNTSNSFKGKIYYLTFTDGNDNLLRDLVPCYRKSDMVAGMWDRVSNSFMCSDTANVIFCGPPIINSAKLELYSNGVFLSGYERNDIATRGTITLNPDYITLHSNSSSMAYVYVRWIAVDLTNYSYISAYFDNVTAANIFGAIWISDSESVNVYGDSISYNHTEISPSTTKIFTLDISNITGTYYLGVGIDTNDASWSNARNVNLYSVILY